MNCMESALRREKSPQILKQFRDETGISYAHLARKCGVGAAYIGNIARGQARPSERIAKLIEYHTRGKVPASAWFPVSGVKK